MSKVIAIARREVQERAFIFVAAAVLALVPFLALVVPASNFTMTDRLGATTMLGFYLGSIFVIGVGVLLGTSLIGRELREKRLSFYFSRPVSGEAIWFGKLLAALALLVGSAAIMFVAPSLLAPASWRGVWGLTPLGVFRVVVLWSGALLLLSHAASSMLRSRSLLLLADFLAAVVFLLGLWTALMPFVLARVGFGVASLFTKGIGAAICAAFVAAGAWQLSRGRTDIRRSHRQLSLALWSGLAIVVVVTAAIVQWFTSVTPADVRSSWAQVAGNSAIVVSGPAAHRRDYSPSFLINVRNGAWLPVPQGVLWTGAVNDAGTAVLTAAPPSPLQMLAWMVARTSWGETSFDISRLQGTKWTTKHRALSLSADQRGGFAAALSHSGDHLAIFGANTVTIYDLRSGRSIGSARADCTGNVQLSFIGEESVVVASAPWRSGVAVFSNAAPPPPGSFLAERFDARTHSLRRLVGFALPPYTAAVGQVSNDGRTLVVRIWGQRGAVNAYRLFDAATGTEERAVNATAPLASRVSWVLHDGSVASMTRRANGAVAEIHEVSGVDRSFDLGPQWFPRSGAELADGRLALCVSSQKNQEWRDTKHSTVLLLDPRSGSVTAAPKSTGIALLPRSLWSGRFGDAATIFPAWEGDTPIAWNALTGERRSLLGR